MNLKICWIIPCLILLSPPGISEARYRYRAAVNSKGTVSARKVVRSTRPHKSLVPKVTITEITSGSP